MNKINSLLVNVNSIGITGHIRPDGDCVGSCLALYNYINANYPGIKVDIYLESFSEKFMFLPGSSEIKNDCLKDKLFDLFIVLDTSDLTRIGEAVKYFNSAKTTLSIDHHISNEYYAGENIVLPNASSASEVLYGMLEEEKINKDIAECLYTGIIYDSGVFKHSNTSETTMQIAGKLMSYGIPFGKIIDSSFYSKSYNQNLILGKALLDSKLALNDKCIYTVITKQQLEDYNVSNRELDGVVDQLRVINGVECAMFLHETSDSEFKVSLRSNDYVDVNKAAGEFGGGGHVKASGCSIKGPVEDIINQLLKVLEKQI